MKNRFDTFKAACWLLDESYDPMNYMTEAEETEELEDNDTEETDDDAEADDLNLDDDAEADADTEVSDDESDVDGNDELEGDEDENPEIDPNDIAGRLDAIEDKLDDIADKNEPDEDETFDLDLANPVCPCCGARLNILNTVADTDEIAAEGGDDDEENTEDDDISALLAGETPEDVEGEGEDITTMDDSLGDVDGLGYDDSEYVSLDDEAEDEDKD